MHSAQTGHIRIVTSASRSPPGKANSAKYLNENPAVAEEIENLIRNELMPKSKKKEVVDPVTGEIEF